jgi:protease-4
MMSMITPLDEEETAFMQATIERIYEGFVNNVAGGRGLEPAFVDSIAQGRVWTGQDAIAIGLVDEIGTIEDALNYTVNLVEPGTDLDKWRIVSYPKPLTQMEMIKESLGQSKVSKANIFKGTPLEGPAASALKWVENWKEHPDTYLFARIPYDIVIK